MDLVRNQTEWAELKKAFESHNKKEELEWSMPEEYPCLAASTLYGATVLTCFVYLADAVMLAEAHGINLRKSAKEQSPASSLGVQVPVVTPAQKDFNTSVSANILTIVNYLVTTGICTADAYERKYAAVLSDLDQTNATNVSELQERLDHFGSKPEGDET